MLSLIILILQFNYITTSNILVIFDNPYYSHELILKSTILKLAQNGHNVTVFSTFLNFSEDPNITRYAFENPGAAIHKKLLKGENLNPLLLLKLLIEEAYKVFKNNINQKDLKKIFKERLKFDLVMIESSSTPMMSIAHYLDCPLIYIFASFTPPILYEMSSGNKFEPAVHRLFDVLNGKDGKLTFFERLWSFIEQIFAGKAILVFKDMLYKKYFMEEIHGLEDYSYSKDIMPKIKLSISASKIMSYFGRIYPVLPQKILQIHSTHLKISQEMTKIDENLEKFLKNSTKDIILISFGSIVQLDQLTVNLTSILLSTIQEFSNDFNFIWKIGKKDKILSTENLFVSSWLPIIEILKNPKVKLFINHGGTRSIEEAIDCKVPMISIPIFLDHFINSEFIEIGKIAKMLKLNSLENHKILVNAIEEMKENYEIYKKNIENLNEIVNDEFESSEDEILEEIENILKFKNSTKYVGYEFPLYQRFHYDVFVFIILIFYSTYKIVKIYLKY
ncbi:hypothetical protein PVAND_016553 [Polypedilum vanderplanki]|uniref:Glucuronosyltransferase n=1 Tax=Polypedilum vanderplanki TaxID=319348 RepID=A0A9J6BFX1_POLVA|nr:hypothetical protein PVAND_016553 [Polypedilum vanderplanki]